jgi:CIC family chloride channel protein
MKSVNLRNGVIPRRTVLGKTFASALCLASGGSVGREGPIVQIGAAMASTVGQALKLNSVRMKTLVACGATAGIAATFNAPIAGAFFSAEVILADFGVGYFAPLVISAVVATVVSHRYIGDDPAFLVPEGLTLTDGRELLLYALLGLLAAFVAQAFMKSLHRMEDVADRLPVWTPLKTALGGLSIGLVGLMAPRSLGNGYEAIEAAMNGEVILASLALLVLAKILATSLTLGSGNSGGIFAPSLFMGVMFGGLFGQFFHGLFPDWTAGSGAYALVGMGAVVAAVIHAPITAIIMIFEMTRDYGIVLPLMISVVLATITSQKLEQHSIYTFKLARQGIDLLKGKDHNVLRKMRVDEVMRRSMDSVNQSTPLSRVLPQLAEFSCHEGFVLDDEGRLKGILTLDEVKRALPQIDLLGDVLIALDVAQTDPPTVGPDDDLDFAMRQFGRSNIEEMPVLDPAQSEKPLGTLVRHDLIRAYNQAMLQEDLAQGLGSRMDSSVRSHVTETVGGYVLEDFPVPREMEGRTLGELNFRKRYHAQVLLICSTRESKHCYSLPEQDTRLQAGDRILVFGSRENVARVRNR